MLHYLVFVYGIVRDRFTAGLMVGKKKTIPLFFGLRGIQEADQFTYQMMSDEAGITRAHGIINGGIFFLIANQIPISGETHADGMIPIGHRLTEGKPTQARSFHGATSFSIS